MKIEKIPIVTHRDPLQPPIITFRYVIELDHREAGEVRAYAAYYHYDSRRSGDNPTAEQLMKWLPH